MNKPHLNRAQHSNIDQNSQQDLNEIIHIDTSSLTGGQGLSIDEDHLEQIQERDALRCFFHLGRKSRVGLVFENIRNSIFLLLHLAGHIVK